MLGAAARLTDRQLRRSPWLLRRVFKAILQCFFLTCRHCPFFETAEKLVHMAEQDMDVGLHYVVACSETRGCGVAAARAEEMCAHARIAT